jgi:hypothetical protein
MMDREKSIHESSTTTAIWTTNEQQTLPTGFPPKGLLPLTPYPLTTDQDSTMIMMIAVKKRINIADGNFIFTGPMKKLQYNYRCARCWDGDNWVLRQGKNRGRRSCPGGFTMLPTRILVNLIEHSCPTVFPSTTTGTVVTMEMAMATMGNTMMTNATPSNILEAATALMTFTSDVENEQKTTGIMAEMAATADANDDNCSTAGHGADQMVGVEGMAGLTTTLPVDAKKEESGKTTRIATMSRTRSRKRPVRSTRCQRPMYADNNNSCVSEFDLQIECPRWCRGSNGVPCSNNVLQAFKYNYTTTDHPLIRVVARGIKGDGVVAREQIAAGTFIVEYTGKKMRGGNHYGNYVMKIGNVLVDAEGYNSYAGKINHGCNPNCQVEKWFVDGKLRAKIVSIKDIRRGKELTIDYQWYGNVKCECGDQNCRGYI